MRATFGISACVASRQYYRQVFVPFIREMRRDRTFHPPFTDMVIDTSSSQVAAFAVPMVMTEGSSGDVVSLMTGGYLIVEINGAQKVSLMTRWRNESGYNAGEFEFGGLPKSANLSVKPLRLVDRSGVTRWTAT